MKVSFVVSYAVAIGGLTVDSNIDYVSACRCRRQHAGSRDSSRVMGVDMNGQIRVPLSDRTDEPERVICINLSELNHRHC